MFDKCYAEQDWTQVHRQQGRWTRWSIEKLDLQQSSPVKERYQPAKRN
jgi:hypothetical protein